MTARELWNQLAAMNPEEQDTWLADREIQVGDQWLEVIEADVRRSTTTPLLLYTDDPSGGRSVPMSSIVSIRSRAS